MNEVNPNSGISSLKHLSSHPVLSLEMAIPLEPCLEAMNIIEYLDKEVKAADVLLTEMVEIRQVLQEYLHNLFSICS